MAIGFKGEGILPVDSVSWDDCQEFCRRVNAKLTRQGGAALRLPTEAEWEYACRAGTATPFSFGATISTEQANYNGNYTYGSGKKGTYREKTTPVGRFPANAWGLHDVHGNLWEWCSDWYASDFYVSRPNPDENPAGPGTGSVRFLRGGSWNNRPWGCRSASRPGGVPGLRGSSLGCRLASGIQ